MSLEISFEQLVPGHLEIVIRSLTGFISIPDVKGSLDRILEYSQFGTERLRSRELRRLQQEEYRIYGFGIVSGDYASKRMHGHILQTPRFLSVVAYDPEIAYLVVEDLPYHRDLRVDGSPEFNGFNLYKDFVQDYERNLIVDGEE